MWARTVWRAIHAACVVVSLGLYVIEWMTGEDGKGFRASKVLFTLVVGLSAGIGAVIGIVLLGHKKVGWVEGLWLAVSTVVLILLTVVDAAVIRSV